MISALLMMRRLAQALPVALREVARRLGMGFIKARAELEEANEARAGS